jgi:hypothetical protein
LILQVSAELDLGGWRYAKLTMPRLDGFQESIEGRCYFESIR